MDFNLNETQSMIQDGARRFFQDSLDTAKVREIEAKEDGFATEVWAQMTKLGWTGLALPEEFGGGNCGQVDLCVLAEEIGRAALSVPLAETLGFAATALQSVPQTALTRDLLGQIATSDTVITPALMEPNGRDERCRPEAKLEETANGGKATGSKVMVPFASSAKVLLTSLISDQGETVLVAIDKDAPGLSLSRHKTLGGNPIFRVTFEDVDVPAKNVFARGDEAEKAISAGLDAATMLSVAEAVGTLEGMIAICADYTATREQFGKKIGSFQAVAHPIANMRIDTDACRLLIAEAAWMLDQGQDATLEISETKVFANEAVVSMVHAAHAVHGAIGYTMEYDLQLFTRRARAFCLSYGDTDTQVERAAAALGV